MITKTTLLHVTDAHISGPGSEFPRDDHKVKVPGADQDTREEVLDLLFARLAERLRREGRQLDGVIFSGDAQDRGRPGGHELLLKLLLEHFGSLGVTPESIVATPGNHDVLRGTAPSTPERYAPFVGVWSRAGCIVPWLDGVDTRLIGGRVGPHCLLAPDHRWAIYPVNTSNWSHVTSILPEPLKDVWDRIPRLLAEGDANREQTLRSQLEALARYDMARVSKGQLEALRTIVAATPKPTNGRQLRIAVMHHHLRSPSLREELKPFADISNLEQVRAFLRGNGFGVVMHGHKHEHAAHFEHIYSADGEDAHRTLVISGATYEVGREQDAVRLITLSGLPYTPRVQIEPIPLPRAGAEMPRSPEIERRLWVSKGQASGPVLVTPGAPTVVEGSSLDEVYARACAAAAEDASRGTLIVHLNLPQDDGTALPIPTEYPAPESLSGHERQTWLGELVKWWQMEKSSLEHRIPYIHGVRLRRYGGKVNQIKRIIQLLRSKESTRAIATLVDPLRDFNSDASGEEFASFCLVEFRRRSIGSGGIVVDAIAFYRAQEITRWWPINIAELRLLQREICTALGFRPGHITTIAADTRTISRSPTQVAMPVIDRWLDQAPEKLHLLANALAHRSIHGDTQRQILGDWQRTLADLGASTQEYNSEPVPLAIEGLYTLASYLKIAANADDRDATELARRLSDLARANEAFEDSGQTPDAFRRWAPTAKGLVTDLEGMTLGLLAPTR
ncbi:metallophosphoesterase [Myxococcus eversor]|uniref:metallophosphoesterase n=1 Tax=Myxococcus eversor TaxID=2709661 RepID=UPI0013D5A0CF|nr:metallophosphoesterase [Myxococcus eversor]